MGNEESFGQRVRERRRELGLTQDELARRVGCAPVTLRKIEYDDLRPSVQIAERLAMALNIPLEERAAFVRLARVERALEPPTPTPAPALEEIGVEDLSGRAIRGYALGERIGEGGMGAVYRAVQPHVEREVAVKIILPKYANHPEFIRRFEAEAQLVARLEHPHIVPLYDYWREPSVAFLVMRLLRGGSLRHLLESGPLPLEMALRMMEQVGAALGAAHRVGVIHRDLKPANVLLDEDQNAYLADFGIAKNLGNPNLEDLTQVDAIVGSPAYISPEQIRSEFVRPQTDIYCLGVVLYELLTGHVPFSGPTPIEVMHQHLSAPLPPLAARRTGLPGALDAVIERATAKDPAQRYPDSESLLADLRHAIRGEASAARTVAPAIELPPLTAADNPYKGLRAFGEADAHDFFGREALIQQLLVRMGEGGDLARFLAVVGPSGSGKSSAVGAGLVPALRRGGLPGSENWYIVELMPGAHPFEELEAALLRVAVNPPASLLEQLKDGERGLLRAVRRILPADETVEVVLVIDQFEEAFTLVQDEAERALFLSSLVTAVLDERSRVRVVITLRADFTDRPLRYVDFGELVQRRSELVLPLTPDELERAILGPAKRVGLRLEPGLTSTMIREVGEQPGALPLLQYALTELFEKREGRMLTKQAYAEVGGVLGALGRRAEDVFTSLEDIGQGLAQQLFLRLVTLGEGTEDTRRRVLRSELVSLFALTPNPSPAGRGESAQSHHRLIPLPEGEGRGEGEMPSILDLFGKHRLLSFDRDPVTRGPTVEVAHEALLREWPRLREWLTESRADVRMQRQLASAAAEWQSANRDTSFLLGGTRLAQFEGWAANTSVALTQHERAYLEASLAERRQREAEEQARQKRELEAARKLAETEKQAASRLRIRNRIISVVGALAIIAAIVAAIFGGQANSTANNNATLAVQNAAIASTAQAANTQEVAQRSTAQAAEAQALAEAQSRATQQAIAQAERDRAESEKQVAFSRELAAAALNNLDVDPERSVLLALQALSEAYSLEAENALHKSIPELHLVHTLTGHAQSVYSVAASQDGKRLASASRDGVVKIWESKSGQQMLSFPAHNGQVFSLTFSPDGTRLATASDDGTAKMWDVASSQQLLVVNHGAPLSAVAFSPDGKQLATAGADAAVRVWDSSSGKELRVLSGHANTARAHSFWMPGGVTEVVFSPDGKQLATAGADQTARIWNAATGQELLVISGHVSEIYIALNPDGTRLATAGVDGLVKVWDISPGSASEEPVLIINHEQQTKSVAFSPDGTRLAAANQTGAAMVWDAATGRTLLALRSHVGILNDLAFMPDGIHLITGGDDHTLKLWEVTLGRELLTIADGVNLVAYSPDGAHLATADLDGLAIRDSTTGEMLLTLTTQYPAGAIAFSPDGKHVAAGSWDTTAKLWDANTGQELFTFSGHTDFVWDVAFSPNGTRLATSSQDGTVKLWDTSSGQEIFTLRHDGPTQGVAYSPDGGRIATVGWADKTVRIWDATTGKELLTLNADFNLTYVAFSPNGQSVAAGASNGGPIVWDISDDKGRVVFTQVGHTGFVAALAFSPDGTRLATGGFDGSMRVWDLEEGREWLALPTHYGPAGKIAFNPDGTRLATSGWDGVVRVYALRLDDLVALAQTRVTRSLTTEECQKYLHVAECP
jgi:WD40 repeat protein/transcriptional regulator with XRE-family HTH domain